jgi:choline dehydrogenase-like flavoprotein
MYLDVEATAAAAATDWDVIVIGAGAVGLLLSVSLARTNLKVLLLESGSRDNGDAKDLNEVRLTGRAHQGATHGRARVVGGTTTLWGGQLTKFTPYDFSRREMMPDCPWPLEAGEMEKYYAQAAALLGLDMARLDDASVFAGIGEVPDEGESGCEIFFTRWLRESNLARRFADDLANLPALTVAPNHHATEIIDGSGDGGIRGVRAVRAGGERIDFNARQVVLACGTIEISRLLLLTAKKAPDLAWAQNPNIGRYFQDHLDLTIGSIQLKNKKAFGNMLENVILDGFKYQPKIRMRAPLLSELGCLNIACTVRFDSSIADDVHMLKQFVKAFVTGTRIDRPLHALRRVFALSHVWFPLAWRYIRHRRILAIADGGVSAIAHCEQRPLWDSRITLDPDTVDRFGDPIVQLHWVVDEVSQMNSLRTFASQLGDFLKRRCDAELELKPEITAGDPLALADAQDSYHQCGGARMASNAALGVVDANCRVFGTKNLYVAGAAVFPSSSFANPTYTALALACRLSGHLMTSRGG